MFDRLIEIALKSALGNPEIKERLRRESKEVKINLMKQENKIIDIDKNNYKVVEVK